MVREIFGLEQLWADLEALDNEVSTEAQHAGYQEIRRLIDRATRWFVDVRFPISDVAAEIERFAPTLAELGPQITSLVRGAELADIESESQRLAALGLPAALAGHLAELLSTFLLLDVVEIANASSHSPAEIAALHFALSDQFYVDEMLTAVTHLPRDDRWSTLARAAMRHDVYAALSAITTSVLRTTDDALAPDDRAAAWVAQNPERVERARTTVRAALDRDTVDLATLVGRATGDAQPAELIPRQDRVGVPQAIRTLAQTRLPCGGRCDAPVGDSAETMASPRPHGASGAGCRTTGRSSLGSSTLITTVSGCTVHSTFHAASSPGKGAVADGVADQFAGDEHHVLHRVGGRPRAGRDRGRARDARRQRWPARAGQALPPSSVLVSVGAGAATYPNARAARPSTNALRYHSGSPLRQSRNRFGHRHADCRRHHGRDRSGIAPARAPPPAGR